MNFKGLILHHEKCVDAKQNQRKDYPQCLKAGQNKEADAQVHELSGGFRPKCVGLQTGVWTLVWQMD